jgi:hypothetical protein
MKLIDTSETARAWFHPSRQQSWEEGLCAPFWTAPWVQRQTVIPQWVEVSEEPRALVMVLGGATSGEKAGFT